MPRPRHARIALRWALASLSCIPAPPRARGRDAACTMYVHWRVVAHSPRVLVVVGGQAHGVHVPAEEGELRGRDDERARDEEVAEHAEVERAFVAQQPEVPS